MAGMRNIGIFAHVDAGKTTLSEQLLAHSGAIRTRGSVDSGTAHTDTLPVERRRGISVKATCVSFHHKGVQINLIDTPGHVDFSAEIERSIWALDAAVVVICGVEGVQPQTEVLFFAMKAQNIPVIFFINKTDRVGADPEGVYGQIQQLLSNAAAMPSDLDTVTELVCDRDDDLAERYLRGESIPDDEVRNCFARLAQAGEAYPVLCGSALRDEGVVPLLDAIVEDFPDPKDVGSLSGVVFAAQQDHTMGRVMSDVITMRGEVVENTGDGQRAILTALLPVVTSLDYAVTLAAVTGGRGAMSVRLHSYRECPLEQGATAERRSIDPLDTSKYILSARNALECGIF